MRGPRFRRSVSLTAAGEHFFRVANESISRIESAVENLGRQELRSAVTITASIGVAGLWLGHAYWLVEAGSH